MLQASRHGRFVRVSLNPPEKPNALNAALCRELAEAIEQGERDEGVGAILLSGAGSSFCSGMDLSEMLTPSESSLAPLHERLFTIGRAATTPIIAAVHGPALAVGERRAVELGISGRIVDAREALALGLVHHVTPATQLMDRAGEIARAVAASSPQAMRSGLRFVADTRDLPWPQAGEVARVRRQEVFQTADFAEGIRAFREKRPPQWPSRVE